MTRAHIYAEIEIEFNSDLLGPRHPDTATSINNLAILHKDMGNRKAALPLYTRALEIREAVLGPRHMAGFTFAWDDLFVAIIDFLSHEVLNKYNIGALEKSLRQFSPTSDIYHNHPFHQQSDEPTSLWMARIYQEYRTVQAACADANCNERCPSESQLIDVVYACANPTIWTIAEKLLNEYHDQPTTFRAAMELMSTAERRVCYQDPKVTLAKQLRASATIAPSPIYAASPTLRSPVSHSAAASTNPLPAVSTTVVPACCCGSPSAAPCLCCICAADALAKNPDFQAIQSLFLCEPPLKQRPTIALHGKTYYKLPAEMPKFSRSFRFSLETHSGCTNCANADILFPHHTWKHCPFYTPPPIVSPCGLNITRLSKA